MNTTTHNILKWSIITGLFAIPFIPFIVTKSLLFPFITGKGFTFRILVEIIFFLWALLAFAEPQYRPKWNFITKSIVVFVVIVFFADLFSKYPYKSFWSNYERMEGFVTIIHLAMYYFVISSMFQTAVWWKRFWNTNLFASLIMSFYGVLQLAGKLTINQGGVRLDATFGNSSYLAIYMVFCMFIALMLLYKEQNKIWKWVYGILFVLQGVILYYTATRGAIGGLVGGLLLTALLVAWKERQNKTARKIALWLLGGVIVLVGAFILLRNTAFIKTSPVLSRFTELSAADIESQGRYYVWPMAVKGALERPILGWGQESFNYVFNKYYNPVMWHQEQWFDRTHNIVLDWLINAGVLGLLSYISLYVGMMYLLWKKTGFTVEEKSLMTGLMAAYVFNNMFVFDNLISYILFFSMLAWVSQSSTDMTGSVKTPRQFQKETVNYLVAPLSIILLVVSVYFVNVRPIQASTALISGITNQSAGPQANLVYLKQAFAYNTFGSDETLEQLVNLSTQVISSQAVSDDIKQGFFTLTQTQITKKLQATPQDARYLLLAGSFYDRVGQYDTAIPYLTDAIKYSPGKQTMYFELGSSYLGKQDYDKSFALFAQGYNLETDNPDAQIIYAIGALYDNKPDIVKAMFAKVGQKTIVNDDRILQTYVNMKDYNSAITILTTRLNNDPTNYNTELQLASVYASAGNKAKAIQLIQDVEAKNPSLKSQLDPYIQQLSQ